MIKTVSHSHFFTIDSAAFMNYNLNVYFLITEMDSCITMIDDVVISGISRETAGCTVTYFQGFSVHELSDISLECEVEIHFFTKM